LRDSDAAQDVVQEVFLRVHTSGGSAPGQLPSVGWLYRVTTNLCLNRMRDASRRNVIMAAYAPTADATVKGEVRVSVATVFGRVPEDLYDTAVYFFVDELSYEQIAQLTGVSRRTVGNRLSAFRQLMNRMVKPATPPHRPQPRQDGVSSSIASASQRPS
jgi:RNA polymerase sigma-70 factor (ECF subfamily)